MKVLAVDPGYERLGLAVLEKNEKKEKVLYSECFRTKKSSRFHQRLFSVGKRVEELIKEFEPEWLAIEKLYFNKNQKTAMEVSEIRGVIIYKALENNMGVKEFAPQEIKVAVTGYGKSPKSQIISMVKSLVEIKNDKALDDEFDAIAVGLTFFAINPLKNL